MIESSSKRRFNKPLNAEHLLKVQDLYSELRAERPEIFGGLPPDTSWLQFRYLRKDTFRTLALAEFQPDVMALHPQAFDWPDDILLRGLIHHELIHYVLGYSLGHMELFGIIETDWRRYADYREARKNFLSKIQNKAGLHHYRCPSCRTTFVRVRPFAPDVSCSICCERYNDGEWSDSFTLITVGHPTREHGDDEERPKARD